MRTDPGITRKYERGSSLSSRVGKMVMVEKPQRVNAFHCGLCTLLPVNPPEIHARVLVMVMQNVEIRVAELLVRKVELHRLFGCGVNAAGTRHFGILFFVISHSVAGVQIERYGKPAVFQRFEKAFVIGKQFFVERIPRPTRALKRISASELRRHVVDDMPVHIHRCNGERNFLFRKLVHKRNVLVFRIRVIARPPVAESVFGQNGRITRQREELFQPAAIVVSEGKHVNVATPLFTRNERPVGVEKAGFRVVVNRHSAARHYALSDFDIPVRHIESARRAFQIAFDGQPFSVCFAFAGKRFSVDDKNDAFRRNAHFIAVFPRVKVGFCKISAKHGLARQVCEIPARAFFDTQNSVG